MQQMPSEWCLYYQGKTVGGTCQGPTESPGGPVVLEMSVTFIGHTSLGCPGGSIHLGTQVVLESTGMPELTGEAMKRP